MDEKNLYKFGKDVEWSLPLLFEHEPCYGTIFKYFQQDGIQLPRINMFGAPACKWCGGRSSIIVDNIKFQLPRLFKYVESINATPTFTFTNTMLEEEHLSNKMCNYILDAGLEIGAHFIVVSDRLKNYIKEKNSDAYVVASTIKPTMRFQGPEKIEVPTVENETNYYNQLLKEYDMVVVRSEYAKNTLLDNPNLLDDLSKIEVIANSYCLENCPKAKAHYDYFSKGYIEEKNNGEIFMCIKQKMCLDTCSMSLDSQALNKLAGYGINHFKLQGRGINASSHNILSMLVHKMFNTEGIYDAIFNDMLFNRIDSEYHFFDEVLRGLFIL